MNDVQQTSIRMLNLRTPHVLFEAEPWTPSPNLLEIDHAFVAIIDLAGINIASVRIDLHPALLAICGVRQVALPEKFSRLHRMGIMAVLSKQWSRSVHRLTLNKLLHIMPMAS